MSSPWPLFSDDLELARGWIEQVWDRESSPLQSGNQALSLGMQDIVSGCMQALVDQPHADECRRQWGFRLARINREVNPYSRLIPESLKRETMLALQNSVLHGHHFRLQLHGGIGDQLEILSLMLPWAQKYSVDLRLLVCSGRLSIIQDIVPPDVSVVSAESDQIPPVSQGMAVRQAVLDYSPGLSFQSFLADACKGWLKNDGLLCCWKAEGRGNAFSAHSRSVPFALVQEFYRSLLDQDPQVNIIDITDWKPWESAFLDAMNVNRVDPRRGRLFDLARIAHGRRVITIDTALAHLCAACGIAADVLLPRFHDERWFELHRPFNSYGRWLKLWRSPDFGSWNSVMQALCASF